MIWVNRPFNKFALRHITWQARWAHYQDGAHTLHPRSSLRSPLHPLARPALIQALISTPIPVLFREHRDCLMIYWPDLPICTVDHNGPSTKEEPVGHALLSPVLPLSSRPPTSSATHLHALWLPCVTPERLGLNVLQASGCKVVYVFLLSNSAVPIRWLLMTGLSWILSPCFHFT